MKTGTIVFKKNEEGAEGFNLLHLSDGDGLNNSCVPCLFLRVSVFTRLLSEL